LCEMPYNWALLCYGLL
nr:immunoglobulin heavy chain junction region [Mus musculus]